MTRQPPDAAGKKRTRPANPYRKRAGWLTAASVQVDEDALVRRYTQDRWSIKRCAEAFGISKQRVSGVLRDHAVQTRDPRQRKDLDADAVIAAYARLGSINAVARMLGTSVAKVTEILDENIIPRDPQGRSVRFGKAGYLPADGGSPGSPGRA